MNTATMEDMSLTQQLATMAALILGIPDALRRVWARRRELAPVWGRYFLTFMLGALFGVLLLRGHHAYLTRNEPIITAADRRAGVQTVTVAETAPAAEPAEEDTQAQAEAIAEAAARREAEAMARVLYGMARYRSKEAQEAICWCILNRVESTQFPDSVEAVCAQPVQWMGYSANNPVTQELYDVANGVLQTWKSGGIRPMPQDYLYLSWSETEIVLRTSFNETARTHYWHAAG